MSDSKDSKPDTLVTNPPPEGRWKLRARRASKGQDTFTGEMLSGDCAQQWLRVWAGLPEEPVRTEGDTEQPPDTWGHDVVRLIRADDKNVTCVLNDNSEVTVEREVREVTVTKRAGPHPWQQGMTREARVKEVEVRVVSRDSGGSLKNVKHEVEELCL